LLDLRYKIRDKELLSTKEFIKKETLIYAIINSINKIIQRNNLKRMNILGVGLGLPGPIDTERGVVHFFPNIPGWKEVNLKSILEKNLKLAVFLDNDAKMMCLAEHKLGAAVGARQAVCITLGTGVGGGIIINGSLYRGSNNASGEIGHLPLNEKGPRCNCGGYACLEAYIGSNRILKEVRGLFKRDISLEELSSKALKQDRKAMTIWLRVAKRLGIALAGVINLLNPDCIVIGGGIAGAGRILFDKVRDTIRERAMPVQARHVKVLKAKLGNDAGVIGAAILVRRGVGR
jgi:glucokinase